MSRKQLYFVLLWIFLSPNIFDFPIFFWQMRSEILTRETIDYFSGWRLSSPFRCVPDFRSEQLVCEKMLLPERVSVLDEVGYKNGQSIPNGSPFSYPLQEVGFCKDIKDNHDSLLCSEEYKKFSSDCVVWTALEPQGGIYLIADCWGYQQLYSMDNPIGVAVFATPSV